MPSFIQKSIYKRIRFVYHFRTWKPHMIFHPPKGKHFISHSHESNFSKSSFHLPHKSRDFSNRLIIQISKFYYPSADRLISVSTSLRRFFKIIFRVLTTACTIRADVLTTADNTPDIERDWLVVWKGEILLPSAEKVILLLSSWQST